MFDIILPIAGVWINIGVIAGVGLLIGFVSGLFGVGGGFFMLNIGPFAVSSHAEIP